MSTLITPSLWEKIHFAESTASIPTIVGGVEQTAPRVTIEQIEAEIESEHYFTAADGAIKTHGPNAMSLQRTLFCVLVLKNGMRVESVNHGSVSAANYSVEYARKDAREKAIDKLWPMFGFELAQKLYREKQAAGVSSLGSSEGKFRKKPVVIEAVQIVKGMDIFSPEWFADAIQQNKIITHGFGKFTREQPYVEIPTLEGTMRGDAGDWIIKGIQGEFYPCKPDIFAATYEVA